MSRPTIRLGSRGEHVIAWQNVVGARPDGAFGPATEALTKDWQKRRGLVPDAIVGAKSWALAGESWTASAPAPSDPRAPACVAALRDANLAWPTRRKQSDGIMGDAAHQLRAKPGEKLKGHNAGDAVDITHDVWGGADCNEIARLAMTDPRVAYVIWNAQIWSRARSDEGWRYYGGPGKNPHRQHIHIEVDPERRGDASPWPWAPKDEE